MSIGSSGEANSKSTLPGLLHDSMVTKSVSTLEICQLVVDLAQNRTNNTSIHRFPRGPLKVGGLSGSFTIARFAFKTKTIRDCPLGFVGL